MKNVETAQSKQSKGKLQEFKDSFRVNKVMYLLMTVPMLYFFVFKYIPMTGNIIAFRKYKLGGSFFGESWQGFKYFELFLTDPTFWDKFVNTISLSTLVLFITFPMPIIFALMLNELGNAKYKKFIQSVTILPKFISVVVVVMIFNTLLSPSSGIVNKIIVSLGHQEIFFMNEEKWFYAIYSVSELWQFLGWNSIIYMAVLSSADQEQYEAARVDGANRWKQAVHITFPVLIPTVSINFIIAVGLFQALIGLVLLVITNKLANKYFEAGLW